MLGDGRMYSETESGGTPAGRVCESRDSQRRLVTSANVRFAIRGLVALAALSALCLSLFTLYLYV